MQRLRRATAFLGACLLATAGAGPGTTPAASGATEHRALVIVDTGATVITRTVTFTEGSITGIAALQRAGADPVVYTYAGQGGAVCRLFGVGRDAGPGCLGGESDARYWTYWRAPAGTSTFTYSRVGAGATAVRDGDVEGWKFGTGAAPPYSPLPPVTPPTTGSPPPTAAPPGGTTGSGPTAGGATPGPPAAAANPGGSAVADPQATTTTTTTTAGELPATGGSGAGTDRARPRTQEAAARRAAAPATTTGGSGAPWSLLALAALLAALGAAVVLVRRARRTADGPAETRGPGGGS
jgi:hypothetical protein